uniref:non-specific serine/threonine protein kinase n=1 Tax=Aegilops tauschii TaxID=37682 RepID=N1QWQ3_AEGTA
MDMVTVPLLLLLLLAPLAAAQWQSCANNNGNYTPNSTYQANLRLLSSTLPKKAASNTNLFATATVGDVPDMVHALTLCRGDFNASACQSCVATAFEDAQQLCAYNKEAAVYYDPCMLKFSNKNFLATTDTDNQGLLLYNTQNFTTNADITQRLLFTLINSTAQSAANSSRRFTTSRLDVGSSPTLYCLMQCTPDLTADDCMACFQSVLSVTLQYLGGRQGGRVLGVRCNMRYEMYPFFQGDPTLRIINLAPEVPAINNNTTPATVQPPAAAPPPDGKATVQEQNGKANLNNQAATNRPEEDALVWRLEEKSSEFTLFDFSEILHATHNFSKENLLGRGGFGPVYKGQLPDEMEIAVKRLASHSGQGFTEFKNEVELIAKLQHNNLVKLLGCCIQGEEKVLVYEYLPNKSLDFFIFDANRTTLVDWKKRREIIEGIAQGLLYLHKHSRLRIIHRDLKASNILLDQDMNPKISDFGLAKIFSSNDIEGSTKRVVGTYGYMAPEYASEGIYSIKSDVFSFGVLLLEILSGKRNSGFHQYGDFLNLLGYSWQLWEGGGWLELLEVSIVKEIHTTEARSNNDVTITEEPDGR